MTNIPQQVTVPNKHDQSVQTEASSDSWQSEVKDLNVLKYKTRVQQEQSSSSCHIAGTVAISSGLTKRSEDRQRVEKQFVICTDFVPGCVTSGQQWFVKEHIYSSEVYAKYTSMHFQDWETFMMVQLLVAQ